MFPESINAEENLITNPMEICGEPRSTATRKRKADNSSPLDNSDDIEDGGVVDLGDGIKEQGGKGDDGEESDASSREEGQDWDVDSFDDGIDYKPKKNLDPNDVIGQKMHRYRSQMYRSKGFEVDRENYPGSVAYRPLGPIDLDKPFMTSGLTGREYMQNMVDLSLERYNRIKGSTVSCEYIVRTICAFVSGLKCYITFMARESPSGDPVEYQAKTEQRIWQKNTHVIFCRPAPKPRDDEFVYADTSSDEDSDVSSRGTGQDWDVDSLDEQPDYKPPRQLAPHAEEENKLRLYRHQMHKSKGFNVDGESYSGESVYFSPVNLDEELLYTELTGREYMEKMVDLALIKYNQVKGTNVTFGHIVRANLTRLDGYKSYITFMAREVPGGGLVEYQAKTERKVWQKTAHAILCRPSPKPKD